MIRSLMSLLVASAAIVALSSVARAERYDLEIPAYNGATAAKIEGQPSTVQTAPSGNGANYSWEQDKTAKFVGGPYGMLPASETTVGSIVTVPTATAAVKH